VPALMHMPHALKRPGSPGISVGIKGNPVFKLGLTLNATNSFFGDMVLPRQTTRQC
jgi:hypothetical protein